MTTPEDEEYEDIYPLMGAIGPYLSFGPLNPVTEDDFAEHADNDLPLNTPENTEWLDDLDNYADADFWEEEEQ